jgi:hypothetical protein
MSYLLANGCSFTDQHYNSRVESVAPYNDWKMWPEYVSEKLNLSFVNLGRNGGSNQRMALTSLEQISKNKPKVLMHLWTDCNRGMIYDYNIKTDDFVRALICADLIIRYDHDGLKQCTKMPSIVGAMVWKILRIWYAEKFNECVNFYSSLHDNNPDILKVLDQYIKNEIYWPKDKLLEWLGSYYLLQSELDYEQLKLGANKRIAIDLKPMLDTYFMCKAMDIQLITVQGIGLGHINQMGLQNCKGKEPIKLGGSSAGGLNIFQIMLNGVCRQAEEIDKHWIEHPMFKQLDDFIFEKKIISHNWPGHARYQNNTYMRNWLKGWKEVSYKDNHPHADTQKLIGDLFYDLYQKKYS